MRLEILDKDVELFQNLICRKSGIYLEGSRLDTLRLGLHTRMESKGFARPGQYYNFLLFHPEGQRELEELLSYITINETYFFRNKAHFAALRDGVLVKLIKENKEGMIRIWSAGCSTGEEPYSIAMTVLDLVQDREDLQIEILGTDVDKEALARAEMGIYKERSLRITEEKYRNGYFNAKNGKFEIDEGLKDIVQFKYFNLMERPYPKPSLGNWDIIFCRNVVIYFNRESFRHVTGSFHSVLADNGYLFMGHSETLDGISDEFSLVEIGGTFVYIKKPEEDAEQKTEDRRVSSVKSQVSSLKDDGLKKPVRSQLVKNAKSKEHTAKSEEHRAEERDKGTRRQGDTETRRLAPSPRYPVSPSPMPYALSPILEEAFELFEREQLDAALDKIEMYMESKPEDATGHLLAGKIYADRGVYERAVDEFEKSIELEPLLTEAHCLLGVIYQGLGQVIKAIDEFRKSVYIDKECVLPYFRLACIYQSNNMKNDALREYNNAVRILSKLQVDEIVQFSGGFTARLLMQICLKNIEELSEF